MSYEEPTTSAKSSLKLPARPESDSIEGDNPGESDAAVIRSDPVISCAFHNLMRGRPVRVSAATFEFVIINCKIPKHNYALVQHQYHEQLKRFEKEWRFLLIGFGAKFERFPALPAEVQMMIWQDTVNEPRVVGLWRSDSVTRRPLLPTQRQSPLFVVSASSRREGIGILKRLYDELTSESLPEVFVNPSADVIWYPGGGPSTSNPVGDAHRRRG